MLFPGLLLHEFAHALLVSINPSSKITDIEVTIHNGGEVEYRYSFMTVTRLFLINYAPFYVNTGVSIYLIQYIIDTEITTILSVVELIILYLLAISFAAKAMPSEVDAYNHIELMREQLFTRRFPIIVILGPIYLVLSIPGLIVSKVRKRSVVAYYSVAISYAILVLAATMVTQLGYIEPISRMEMILESYEF
jgi:hypothetical protein